MALEATGELGAGIVARLSTVRPTTAQARLPGEVGGPALEVNAMSLTTPLPRPRPPLPDEHTEGPPRDVVRLGPVGLGSALAYLLLWAVALFAVQVLSLVMAHLALERLGVLASVSSALAAVLGEDEPAGRVLPALELSALLPWVLIAAAALSVLWLVASFVLVLVHNAVVALTGGLRVHVRQEGGAAVAAASGS